MSERAEVPLVAIIGPTASGKSTLGVWLSERLNGEVIACDSTQLYRGFNIGTAKPSDAERRGVPHHLLDVLEGAEEATAGAYREWAVAMLEDLRTRKKLPIFTVGTGLYLRVLLEGLADVPQRSEQLRERLRESAAEHGSGYLHGVLRRLDPVSSLRIAPADEQKLIRAIEVCLLAQRPLSQVYESGRKPLRGWRAVKIGLAPGRERLIERIHARTEEMLAAGWLEEVQTLLKQGVAENAKGFDFIGYRELQEVLAGRMRLDEAREAIQQATRRYAKRQVTWFRREHGVEWLNGFGDEERIQKQAREKIQAVAGDLC